MAKRWYVVHAFSGYEKKVMLSLQERIALQPRRVHSRLRMVRVTMHCLDLGMLGSLVVFDHPTPECKGSALTSGSLRRAYLRQRLRSERSWGERPSSQLLAVLGTPAFGQAGCSAPDDRSTRSVWDQKQCKLNQSIKMHY